MVGMIYQDNASWAHINSSAYEVGMAFHVSGGFTVSSLQWFRYQTGSQVAPEIVRLWDADTSTELARLTSIPDDGTVAWQAANLATPVDLVVGTNYIVSAYFPGSAGQPSRSTPGVPTSPVVLSANARRYLAGSAGFPSSADSGSYIGVDIGGLIVPGPNDPPTQGSIGALGEDWFSSDPTINTHHADLPWRTDANVTDIKTLATGSNGFVATKSELDATKIVSDAIHDLLTSANHNLGTLWDLAGHLADLEIAAWQNFFGAGEQRLTGPDSAGGSAFYTADGQLVSQLIAEIWQRTLVLRNTSAFGLPPWAMSAEADFTDAIAFAEPADAYVLNITSYQPTQPATSSPAGLWLPRLGWWCVLTGSLASERRFVDFEQEMLSDQGRRMAGCAIQLKPGTVAHVQAWLLA
jgi:hypothetical protein